MGETISIQRGFADLVLSQRQRKSSFLDEVDRMVDRRPIERVSKRNYKKKASADDRPAYPALPLFKMLLIQRWYNLSDPGLEEAVDDRISFLRFTGFSLENSIPDETTICRFRNQLGKSDLFEKWLDKINEQVQSRQLRQGYPLGSEKPSLATLSPLRPSEGQDRLIIPAYLSPAGIRLIPHIRVSIKMGSGIFVIKPFSKQELLDAVRDVLDG
jgi:transposase